MNLRIAEIAHCLAWSGLPVSLMQEMLERRSYIRTRASRGTPLFSDECIAVAGIDAAELAGLLRDEKATAIFLSERGVTDVSCRALSEFFKRRHGLKIGAADMALLSSRRGCAVRPAVGLAFSSGSGAPTAQPLSFPAADLDEDLLRELKADIEALAVIGTDENTRAEFLANVPADARAFRALVNAEWRELSPNVAARLHADGVPRLLQKLGVAYGAGGISRTALKRERPRLVRGLRKLAREMPKVGNVDKVLAGI